MRRLAVPALLLALAALAAGPAPAARGDEPAQPPPTVEAEKGRFLVWLDLKGSFAPATPAEVAVRFEAYGGELRIAESRPEGPVEAGQVLVRFETDKIDEQLEGAELDLAIAREALARQEEDTRRQEEATAIALVREETEAKRAEEALAWFREVDRPMRVREADWRLQGSRDNLADQEEELAQLEKMYKADDLTEETEEIVLKRAVRQLARSKQSLEFQTTRSKHGTEVELPREEENLVLARRKEANDLERLRATVGPATRLARLEVEKARLAVARQEEAVARLRRDREALSVRAPAAGIAVPGAFAKGRWSGPEDAARALERGRAVKPEQTLYTIVRPGEVAVRAIVGEAALLQLAPGQEAVVQPAATPEQTRKAKVARVARTSANEEFEVTLELTEPDERLMPGWGCKVRVLAAERPEAVTVPAASVAADGERKVVHVLAEGTVSPREVRTGATSGGRTEILEGLAAGERVLKSPPKPQ